MPTANRVWKVAAALVVIAALGLAVFTTVGIYRAEQLAEATTEPELEKAVGLAPANSDAWARLGALREKRGETSGAAKALLQAVELNRYDAAAWVDLGLHWETEGDNTKAKQCLREAVRVNGGFYPRWVLANFYLRQGGGEPFWAVMRQAISRNQADLTGAFELYWRAFDDPNEILQKGIPETPEINRRYFRFLLESNRTAAAAGPWNRIAGRLQPADLPWATRYLDQLVATQSVPEAVQVWNHLCEARLLREQPLDPARGRVLTNGRFELPSSGLAFDWRLARAEGVTADRQASGGASMLCIHLSGAHPEATELLSQLAPVEENETYHLRYHYATAGLPDETGLYWTVEESPGGAKLMSGPSLAAADEGSKEGEATVRTGPRTRLIRLVLAYRRSPGTIRTAGSVCLSDVDLALAGGMPPGTEAPGNRSRKVQP
jgi:tetratricopeptide (TPR) repeat protein